jgi:hypothetical protein
LLRLAQLRLTDAVRSIVTALDATVDPTRRARLLPAHIEILLANGDRDAAANACLELTEPATRFDSTVLGAQAAQATGELRIAERNPRAALRDLKNARESFALCSMPTSQQRESAHPQTTARLRATSYRH